jgi:hypothetical protein
MTTGRNHPCPCGSGIKYKRCCLRKNEETKARARDDARGRRTAELTDLPIEELKGRFTSASTDEERDSLGFAIAQAHQDRGEHEAALDVLRALPKGDATSELVRRHLSAVSVSALGDPGRAAEMYEPLLTDGAFEGLNPQVKTELMMEAGKANSFAGNDRRARELWDMSLSQYKSLKDPSGMARAESNLATLLLQDADPNEQERGVAIIEKCSRVKAQVGDLEGLANNFCILPLHFWEKRRYARSLAYMRRAKTAANPLGGSRILCRMTSSSKPR